MRMRWVIKHSTRRESRRGCDVAVVCSSPSLSAVAFWCCANLLCLCVCVDDNNALRACERAVCALFRIQFIIAINLSGN